jgi:hypothetical protein
MHTSVHGLTNSATDIGYCSIEKTKKTVLNRSCSELFSETDGLGQQSSRRPLTTESAGLPPVNNQSLELSAEESANVHVYHQVNRSVVNITTRGGDDGLFFRRHVKRRELAAT